MLVFNQISDDTLAWFGRKFFLDESFDSWHKNGRKPGGMTMFDPNTPAPWEIGVHSYVKIVGTDTECADMSNPRGHIYGTLWVVVARDESGYQREYDLYLGTQEEAERLANTFTGWDPNGDDWITIDPAYGSPAYLDQAGV